MPGPPFVLGAVGADDAAVAGSADFSIASSVATFIVSCSGAVPLKSASLVASSKPNCVT